MQLGCLAIVNGSQESIIQTKIGLGIGQTKLKFEQRALASGTLAKSAGGESGGKR